MLEESGNFRQLLFIILVIFKRTVYYLLKWINFSVKKQNIKNNTGKFSKNTGKVEKSEFGQSGTVATMNLFSFD